MGPFVYNYRPMREKSYLTLHRGLLTVALYQIHDASKVRLASVWAVPLAAVLKDGARPGETTLTSVSPVSRPNGNVAVEGCIETSATPVCELRQSLHA